MRILLLLPLLIFLNSCSPNSLKENIAGKVFTLEREGQSGYMVFRADGGFLWGQDRDLEDLGMAYKVEGNTVLILFNGEEIDGVGRMLFSSSSPHVGDQLEWGPNEDDKQKFTIKKIEPHEHHAQHEYHEQVPLPNLDDPEELNKVLVEAVDVDEMEEPDVSGQDRREFYYEKNKQTPYSGWIKTMHSSGKVEGVAQLKDGLQHGKYVTWHENGQKEFEYNYKDSREIAVQRAWDEDGTLTREATYKNGVLISEKEL